MIGAIVGIEIPIANLEGSWKVSQNRPAQDKPAIVEGLQANGDDRSIAMAQLVKSR